ncbi:MAG: ATP-binding cassette domain-containing protein [Gammaproteobacteria bacterium]|nr:ATP-binding cassette domain-containing protein [Gammaproteobacteria bacterium]
MRPVPAAANPRYASLAELAARLGTLVPCAGNLPVELDDPDSVWFIEQGVVDLFLIERRRGVAQAAPQHALRRDSGGLLPGVAPDESSDDDGTTLCMVAKGLPGTLLKRLPASLLAEVDPAELARQADTWVTALTDVLSRFASPLPRPTALVEPDTPQAVAPGILAAHSRVAWLEPPLGKSAYLDVLDPADVLATSDEHGVMHKVPLTRSAWLALSSEAEISADSTETLARQGRLLGALASFHAVALALERINRRLALVDEVNLERAWMASRHTAEQSARRRLFNIHDLPIGEEVGGEPATVASEESLLAALRTIGRREGIEFREPPRATSAASALSVEDVLDVSGVRARRVRLDSERSWWRGDSNALLAFRAADGQPVALLPGMFGRYRQVDPVTKRSVRMTAARAAALKNEAWMFHAPLPPGPLQPSGLMRLALKGSAGDLLRLVLAGLPAGLIKLLPALALGFVANHVAAGGGNDALHAVVLTLAGFGLLGALLHLAQSSALMRLEGRSASRFEAAFWDRLTRLTPATLRRQPTGALAMSGMSFQSLRDGLRDVVADSVLSVMFLLPVLAVILFYDVTLGMVALGFSVASLSVTVALGLWQLRPWTRLITATRRVAGNLFQIIGGIAKLRVDNAEGSAFAIWAQDYREQKRAELDLGAIEGHSRAFAAALPFLAVAAVLFAAVMSGAQSSVPVADFLVVLIVFTTFQSAVARLGESVGAVAAMLPAFAEMRPLLAAVPETEAEGEPVEHLGGDVLFDRVSFRYEADGPLILDDVTIRARRGEFVAIAGESGAGKSTLFRLALGMERPSAGAVYYDGRDLRHLNLRQLRRRIGAVPQAVGLHPQDIWDNVVSHHTDAATDEVWSAARTAEVEEQIKTMPMGMMTVVGTSGSVLSGGESQRVSIARAVLGSPPVMLLDEATNWLDNEGQAKVMENLAVQTSTRIVIAHRLSTLREANRIYVLKAGRVVQVGSFQELMEVDGVFRELVTRQVA